MGYREAILANNPWGYWRQQEASGTTFADESPNARPLTITGTPTFGLDGRVKGGKAVEYPANTTTYGKSAVGWGGSTSFTMECWINIPTYGSSGDIALISIGLNATGGTSQNASLRVTPVTGGYYQAQLYFNNGSNRTISSTYNMSKDTWYYVAATAGPSGVVIRVNDATVGTSALIPTAYTNPVWVRAGYFNTAIPIRVAEPAIYPTVLSPTVLSAHYNTGLADEIVDFPITVDTAATQLDDLVNFPIDLSTTTSIEYMEVSGTADFPFEVTFTNDGGQRVEQLNAMLEVLDENLRRAPTAVTVAVSGGWPNDDVEFDVDGTTVFTGTLDTDGSLVALSLPVPWDAAAGEHTVTMTSLTGAPGYTISATFNLELGPAASPVVIGPDADPVEIAAAQTSTGVRRWVLQDLMPGGLGSYVMPANPATMTSPHFQRLLSFEHTTSPAEGIYHISEVAEHAVEWQFSGFCHTQEFYEALQAYYALNRRFYLIDHRNRAWTVAFTSLDMRARLRSDVNGALTDWAHDYTVSALIYDQDWKVPQ